MELPNSGGRVIADYLYDALNRLELLRHFKDNNGNSLFDGGDQLLAEYDYTVRADGKRTTAVERIDLDGNGTLDTTTIEWLYDALGRLIEERYDFAFGTASDYLTRYAHDLVSNRVKLTKDIGNANPASFTADEVTDYFYDANDRLLHELADKPDTANDTNTVYEYGANNLGTQQTAKTVRSGLTAGSGALRENHVYSYNRQGRLSRVEIDGDGVGGAETTVDYEYNDAGIRVTQSAGGDKTLYVVDPQNHTGYAHVLEERAAVNGQLERSYTLGHQVLGQFDPTNGPLWLLADGHGSTRGLVDALGQPLTGQVYRYDAFGNRLDSSQALTPIQFAGEWLEALSKLNYNRARWYDPATGRWNRMDPFAGIIQDPISLHKYLFTHGDPVNFRDPSGLTTFLAELGSAAHRVISGLHAGAHPGHAVTYRMGIPGAASLILPDIMNFSTGKIGEIKPLSAGSIAAGYTQLRAAIAIANGRLWTYRGNQIQLPKKVPHNVPQQDWIAETWSPGVRALLPGLVNPLFDDFVIVTLGNFDGLILYKRFRAPRRQTAAAYAPAAEKLAQEVVRQLHVLPNGQLDPVALDVLNWRLEFKVNEVMLRGLIGAGAVASSLYLAHGLTTMFAPSLSLRFV